MTICVWLKDYSLNFKHQLQGTYLIKQHLPEILRLFTIQSSTPQATALKAAQCVENVLPVGLDVSLINNKQDIAEILDILWYNFKLIHILNKIIFLELVYIYLDLVQTISVYFLLTLPKMQDKMLYIYIYILSNFSLKLRKYNFRYVMCGVVWFEV